MQWSIFMAAFWFVAAVTFAAIAAIAVERVKNERERHATELESYKRVGRWFEKRVAELEQESASLAAQVIQAGTVPVPRYAMPPIHEDDVEYAYDQTGLVQDKLNPRDYVTVE